MKACIHRKAFTLEHHPLSNRKKPQKVVAREVPAQVVGPTGIKQATADDGGRRGTRKEQPRLRSRATPRGDDELVEN